MNNTITSEQTHAVAETYHNWLTGLALSIITKIGAHTAEEFIFRLFRVQHTEKFLKGLTKLGLDNEPDAVACAKYHYFSNQLGGVSVEYFEESPTKAWIRYPPPRWIWQDSAICAVPENVNRAMLYGWHAQNGVTLKNPRLGFVCTGTTVEGSSGLEGFYLQYPKPLSPEQRLQFRFDLECPLIESKTLPILNNELWPEERKAKAYRNYAIEYLRTALPLLPKILGAENAERVGLICAKQIGMQSYSKLKTAFEIKDLTAESFALFLKDFMTACGDKAELKGDSVIERTFWRIFPENPSAFAEKCESLLFSGFLAAHNRFLTLKTNKLKTGTQIEIS